jgi:hypothetical protein
LYNLNVSRGKRFPQFVTGIKILRRQGDHLTLYLDVVLSDNYGDADEASSVLKLDTLSFGKIVIVIVILLVFLKSHWVYNHEDVEQFHSTNNKIRFEACHPRCV